MADFALDGEVRKVVGKKVRQIRSEGLVPATIYGPKTEPVVVQFPYRAIELALMNAGGTNLIDLKIGGKTYPVLAREVQRDVVRGDILHVDFFAVDQSQKIRVEIPIMMEGRSPVVASREGILITGPNSLTVEVYPNDIRNQIVVDLSTLVALGDEIQVKDLNLGENTTIINDPTEMLAKIVQPAAARSALLETEGEGIEGEAVEGDEDEANEDTED